MALALVAGVPAASADTISPNDLPINEYTCFASAGGCVWDPGSGQYVAGGDGVSIDNYFFHDPGDGTTPADWASWFQGDSGATIPAQWADADMIADEATNLGVLPELAGTATEAGEGLSLMQAIAATGTGLAVCGSGIGTAVCVAAGVGALAGATYGEMRIGDPLHLGEAGHVLAKFGFALNLAQGQTPTTFASDYGQAWKPVMAPFTIGTGSTALTVPAGLYYENTNLATVVTDPDCGTTQGGTTYPACTESSTWGDEKPYFQEMYQIIEQMIVPGYQASPLNLVPHRYIGINATTGERQEVVGYPATDLHNAILPTTNLQNDDGSYDPNIKVAVPWPTQGGQGTDGRPSSGTGNGEPVLDPTAGPGTASKAKTSTKTRVDCLADPTDFSCHNDGTDPDWSGGAAVYNMPNVIGMINTDAIAAIDAAADGAYVTRPTITELQLDIAHADITQPAGAVIDADPVADTQLKEGATVTLTENPDPMPLVVLQPYEYETGEHYCDRLTAAGFSCSIAQLTQGDPRVDGRLGPGEVVSTDPKVGTRFAPVPEGDPAPAVTVTTNPSDEPYPPNDPNSDPNSDGSGTGAPPAPAGSCSCPALDMTPLTNSALGDKFPFAVIGWAAGIVGAFNVTAQAPSIDWSMPTPATPDGHVAAGSITQTFSLSWWDSFMSTIRALETWALWAGALWYVGFRMLGFTWGGDPSASLDQTFNED